MRWLAWMGVLVVAPLGVMTACGGATGPTSTGGAGGDGSGAGGPCTASGHECAENEVCVWADGSCGRHGEQGTCYERPTMCGDEGPQEACGCDGQIYIGGACAAIAGVDLDRSGQCTPGPGQFACGSAVCEGGTYCSGDQGNCPPLPADCTDCACLQMQVCPGTCTGDATTGITLTCPMH